MQIPMQSLSQDTSAEVQDNVNNDIQKDDLKKSAQARPLTLGEISSDFVMSYKNRENFKNSGFLPIVTSILCGIAFGICFNKSRVFEPYMIIAQMKFEKFLMLKFFLSVVGTACFIGSIVSYYYPNQFGIARSKFLGTNNLFAVTLGAIILGIGMSTSGACPGMLTIQLGSGVPNCALVLIGCLFGALFYGLAEPFTRKIFKIVNININYVFLDDYITKISFIWFGIAFGIMCWIMVIIFEILFPWKSELVIQNVPNCNYLTCGSWNPEICGILIGLLQFPLIVVLGNTIGTSSSYICLMGQWLRLTSEDTRDTFNHFKSQLNRFSQPMFIMCAVLGSWIAVGLNANQSNLNVAKYPYDDINGINKFRALIGGFLIIVGSRLSKGCPSGHGFSGFMLMAIPSFCAVGGMFAGGIATAFSLS